MDPTLDDRLWRPSLPARAGAWAMVVLGLMAAALALASAASGDRREAAGPLFLAGSGLLFAAGAWRWGLHPHLAATAPGIDVRNPLRSVLVPWSDVEGVVPGSGGIIVLRRPSPLGQHATVTSVGLAEAGHVKAWAVQKSSWAHWFGRRVRAEEVAHELAQRARRTQRGLSPPAPPGGGGERPAGTPPR